MQKLVRTRLFVVQICYFWGMFCVFLSASLAMLHFVLEITQDTTAINWSSTLYARAPEIDGWFNEYTLCTMSGDHEIVLEKKAVQIPKMKKLDKHRIIGFLPQTGTPTSHNTPPHHHTRCKFKEGRLSPKYSLVYTNNPPPSDCKREIHLGKANHFEDDLLNLCTGPPEFKSNT